MRHNYGIENINCILFFIILLEWHNILNNRIKHGISDHLEMVYFYYYNSFFILSKFKISD